MICEAYFRDGTIKSPMDNVCLDILNKKNQRLEQINSNKTVEGCLDGEKCEKVVREDAMKHLIKLKQETICSKEDHQCKMRYRDTLSVYLYANQNKNFEPHKFIKSFLSAKNTPVEEEFKKYNHIHKHGNEYLAFINHFNTSLDQYCEPASMNTEHCKNQYRQIGMDMVDECVYNSPNNVFNCLKNIKTSQIEKKIEVVNSYNYQNNNETIKNLTCNITCMNDNQCYKKCRDYCYQKMGNCDKGNVCFNELKTCSKYHDNL